MGAIDSVSQDRFPRQGSYLGRRVKVYFHYDTNATVGGEIVRDDVEEPYRTIIRLDDGRHVLSTECQYTPDRG
ncbi:hypothetical protein A5721_10855 [Mycobacterium vulneris]|nr:hypothetical protein A5721_10855 [Mycolicibacterium vulneris]